MAREALPFDLTRQVPPRALVTYAAALGWQPVLGVNGTVATYHRPDSRAQQVRIALDEGLSDYAEMTAEVVRKLAEFEDRPAREVLEHLLLPPADLLDFREVSRDAEAGTLSFERAVRSLNGTKRVLLSAAHSALVPQTYHPRLSRSEADDFLNRCRFGQTKSGSFVFRIACPLDLAVALPGMEPEPFTRRVTSLLMDTLGALAGAAETLRADDLLDPGRHPGVSANLCESLLLLRPEDDRAHVTVSAVWSRARLPESRERTRNVELRQEAFEVAETLAPRLRSQPHPRPDRFIAFVDALRGQPGPTDPRPAGEVDFTIFDEEQGEIHARGVLSVDDYAKAGAAHLESDPVAFKAILRRLPRMSRVESITDFERLVFESPEAQTNETPF
ncbi:MAG: hypothetical protein J2P46_07895 [Zavarzinella sp.]|nr:hypothetical protein [Zavarzinella sp.]